MQPLRAVHGYWNLPFPIMQFPIELCHGLQEVCAEIVSQDSFQLCCKFKFRTMEIDLICHVPGNDVPLSVMGPIRFPLHSSRRQQVCSMLRDHCIEGAECRADCLSILFAISAAWPR